MSSSQATRSRIRIHRINLGESPEVFGARIGVTGMTIRRVETGKRMTVRTAFVIAKDMGLAVVDLWPPTTRTAAAA